MNNQIYLNLSAVFYTFLIAFCFFCKKKINNIETKTYGYLIIVSMIELVFGLISTMFLEFNLPYVFMIIFTKLFFCSILSWIFTFSKYMFNIGNCDKCNFLINIVFIIALILISFTGLNLSYIDGLIYTSGYSILALEFSTVFMIFLCLCVGIKNIKSYDKRFLPLWIFLVLGIIFTIVQILHPELFLIVPLEVFITSVMYHTIENPDVKMIEELQVARDQADKANRAKTEFLSSMSHEIRTPLNAIVGFSDCIMEADDLLEAKENAQDIVNASQTLLEIVNGILDISKIEAGKIEIVNSSYAAFDTFTELAKLITPKMKEKGLDFSFNIAEDLPNTLYGDHTNLKKVITNLLSNACKYTDRGFVHYEVNCVNSKDVCKLIISVEDSGRGIKKENIDKMFTKFQRLDEDRNTTIEGTGLGLAITKQLTELMGGRIIVHTVYGEGSKFTVVVNQKIEKTEIKKVSKVKTSLDLCDVRILVVDDTELNLKVACKLLERYNANMIDTCDNGFDCIEKIKSGKVYDFILLDDMMPKMSGVETLKKLKEISGFNIPTIALTANAISGMRDKYIADGFDDYLAKPIEREQLIHVVNQILGRSITEKIDVIVEDRDSEISNKFVFLDEFNSEQYLIDNEVNLEYALELLGDMDMYNMTISDFLMEVEDKWKRIVEYKDSSNMKDYAIEVHSLKSDCKYLGFMTLADIAYEHELKSKDNDVDFIYKNFARFEKEYMRVLDVIKKYVDNIVNN